MNLLIDDLPESVNGIPINTDYRKMVQFELLIQDSEISNLDKMALAIDLLYREPVPDLQTAWDGLLWYHHGALEGNRKGGGQSGGGKALYDFDQDAGLIYAAFWQVYHLDLQWQPLHWWTFRELLLHLPDTCTMGKIMQIRGADVGKMKGTEKKYYQKMQALYAVKRGNISSAMTAAEREKMMREKAVKRYMEAQEWLQEKNK